MMKLPKEAVFIPAMGPQYYTYWSDISKNSCKEFNGHDFKWFTDKSYLKYPYSLMTAFFGMKDPSFRDNIRFPRDNHLLIGDSGGFQLESFRRRGDPVNVNPLDVLKWEENNCDIGMNLDVPLGHDYQNSFDDCLARSVKNFTLFRDNRKNPNMKLYNVLHGRNVAELQKWYDTVKEFPFDGWALGLKGTIFEQIFGFFLLHENESDMKDAFHLFGVSDLKSIIALSIVAQEFNMPITFDSSSYSMGSRDRRFYFPGSVRYYTEFRRTAKNAMKNVPCDCPVCKDLKIEDLYSQSYPGTPLLISLHDLYQYVEVTRRTNIMVKDSEVLEAYASSESEMPLVAKLYSMIEQYKSGGCKKVIDKNPDLFIQEKIIYHPNLDGFNEIADRDRILSPLEVNYYEIDSESRF